MPEWSRNTAWRQGQLLSDYAASAIGLLHPESPDDTLVIIATHPCDLTQLPDKEPHVEVVVGRRIDQLDGNHTHAKSSRTIHVKFEGDEPLLAEFVVTEKQYVTKAVLAKFEPETRFHLSPTSLNTFQIWLASRYRRSAFPDEFERRMKISKLDSKISKIIKPLGEMITAVFFDVDEGREISKSGPDDVYLLDIFMLYAVEPDVDAAETAALKAVAEIKQAFKGRLFDAATGTWKNIELRYVDAISEDALTYRDSQLLKKWRLDHISLGADPQQPVLAE
ncbi:MAG: hypothetical protein SCI25_01895 [Desulfuromonadales bacterium]|nr:hypothetical protein [Desulfuromonadales bacterium]MDW7756176.1 hypothetical protein [Desulfuromonadales bacterium]